MAKTFSFNALRKAGKTGQTVEVYLRRLRFRASRQITVKRQEGMALRWKRIQL